MSRRFLSEFGENEQINEIFLLSEKQLRQNRNGNLYLQMRLADKTGTVTAMMWNATNKSATGINSGDYVRIEGASQLFNGTIQVIVNQIEAVDPGGVFEDDFIQVPRATIDDLTAQLRSMLGQIKNPHLRNLVDCFLSDEAFLKKFTRAPAAIKHHHAYHGGLLDHVVSLMRLAAAVAPNYDDVDTDTLMMGAFLHDVGKIDELFYRRELGYTDEGQLIGHLVMGVGILERQIARVEKLTEEEFPEDLALQLKHMIVSHHGKLEFGSPKVPMTFEAVTLHYLDDLDAKLKSMQQLIEEDPNADSNWTSYQPTLGRKMYKPNANP